MILGCDTETTGLVAQDLTLLEVALVLCDDELVIQDQVSVLMPVDPEPAYAKADAYVQGMHTKNGLWQDLWNQWQTIKDQDPEVLHRQVESYLVTWCNDRGVYPKHGPMFGQGIAYDRDVLAVHLPQLRNIWNHRVLDISGLKYLASKWYGLKYTDTGSHRALDDILGSFECMRWLRREMFR